MCRAQTVTSIHSTCITHHAHNHKIRTQQHPYLTLTHYHATTWVVSCWWLNLQSTSRPTTNRQANHQQATPTTAHLRRANLHQGTKEETAFAFGSKPQYNCCSSAKHCFWRQSPSWPEYEIQAKTLLTKKKKGKGAGVPLASPSQLLHTQVSPLSLYLINFPYSNLLTSLFFLGISCLTRCFLRAKLRRPPPLKANKKQTSR